LELNFIYFDVNINTSLLIELNGELVFSCNNWDGLAKLGNFEVNNKQLITPNLFPVVDPLQQEFELSLMKSKFKFNQVITSSYLMSKRQGSHDYNSYPDIHEYLNFDGVVMMDSGAFQVLMYGDIDLGVEDTLILQKQVKPEIGVIMDHPIGYDTTYAEASKRIDNTIINLRKSIPHFEGSDINWTLPIQGGKYINLLRRYLEEVTKKDILEHFSFFALGSVVPVMINQDYSTLVKMIATAREYLPTTYPLHLFGAGHPAMFALATFLGCDTFDSAAYALMAKDNRYMSIGGTYNLHDINEFGCICPVCVDYTPKELISEDKRMKKQKLSEHNLWVSRAELENIRESIRGGNLWDLVLQRSGSVPHLKRATNLALKYINTGKLGELYSAGIPQSRSSQLRIKSKYDIFRVEFQRVKEASMSIFERLPPKKMIAIAFLMDISIFNKIPLHQIPTDIEETVCLILPPFGIVPIQLTEMYPIGQLIHELDYDEFPMEFILYQIQHLIKLGLEELVLILPDHWPKTSINSIENLDIKTTQIYAEKPMTEFLNLVRKN